MSHGVLLSCCFGLWLAACSTAQPRRGPSGDQGVDRGHRSDGGQDAAPPDDARQMAIDGAGTSDAGSDGPVRGVRTSAQLQAALNNAQIHAYDNIVLGSAMGLDIGCGNHNVIHNNLIASYAAFNRLKDDTSYKAIDLSRYRSFSAGEIGQFSKKRCADGIALSGNYRSLVFDNEITDCTGDLVLSYDHWISGTRHNSVHGHRENLFFRNKIHDNNAYRTIREYNKQDPGVTYQAMYFHNLFANNDSTTDIVFEHSEGLLFYNNTIVRGDQVHLQERSVNAVVKNNVFFDSGYDISADSTGVDTGNNCQTENAAVFKGLSAADFRLNTASKNPCVDTGADLGALLKARLQPFVDSYDGEYRYYDDFDIAFEFGLDLDGSSQGASWDCGAYFATE